METVEQKSKILVVGSTGHIGQFIVTAGAMLGHPTFALVRDPNPSEPSKAAILQAFKDSGVTLLQGDLYDHQSLVRAFKQVDVVISTLGFKQTADQVLLIAAIKEAGNIKRFFPSEFGNDVDRLHAVEPAKSAFEVKARVRRAVEAEGVPHTFVSANFFAGYFLPTLCQPRATSPPRVRVAVFGDGNTRAFFVDEGDIATYTIKAANDPRTLNKILYIRPPANICSFNELVALWEKKIGKTLERTYLSEEEILTKIEESPGLLKGLLAILHSVFVKGDQTNFEIEPSFGVEASELYPDVDYTTIDQYLDNFVSLEGNCCSSLLDNLESR